MDELQPIVDAIEAGNKAAADRFASVEATLKKHADDLDARLIELEQRQHSALPGTMQRKGDGDPVASAIVDSADVKAVLDRRHPKTGLEVKAADLLLRKAAVTNGPFANSMRPDGIVTPLERRVWIHQLLPVLPGIGSSVEWTREASFTNAAASQTEEGAAKPESELAGELVDTKFSTIAHFINVSRQVLGDTLALRAWLDSRLRYGLRLEIDRQMLNGTGLNGELGGFLLPANHTPFVPEEAETSIDSLRRAVAMLQVNNAAPDTVILHPNDFSAMERVKTQNLEYIIGDPTGAAADVLWRCNVASTPAMTEGKFLIMDAAQAAGFWLRQDAVILVSESHSDNFTKNLVTVLAEMRAALTVWRPDAVAYGDLVATG